MANIIRGLEIMMTIKWMDIKTAPTKKGVRFLAKDKDGFIFITEHAPENVTNGCYGVVDSCCGYYENMNPIKWASLK